MNCPQPELADDFTPRNRQKYTPNRLTLLISSLLVIVVASFLLWREIQLHAAQQLIRDCVGQNNCSSMTEALETLVQAQKSLKLFYLDHANLEAANLSPADLDRANLSHANLKAANLSHANLYRTNLSHANLEAANLKSANLDRALLINTKNVTPTQLKLACNWSTAFYQGHFDDEYSEWIIDHQANQQFINQLQLARDSEPKKPVDCSKWK